MNIDEILQLEIASNTVLAWSVAIAIALAVSTAIYVARTLLAHRLQPLAEQSDTPIWDILQAVNRRTTRLFVLLIALYLASLFLTVPGDLRAIFTKTIVIAVLIQAGLWTSAAIRILLENYQHRQEAKDSASVSTLNILSLLGRLILWTLVLLLVLDNLGVNITALVTGLGIGGIAVALAVQTVLGDLLASLSIVLDKPFAIGDFLIVSEHMGSVEYIGLKTTRIRSLSGEQLVFSNADLLQSRIRNFGRMFERRVVFKIGVTYQTPRERLTEIPGIIRAAIENQEKTRFDRSHFVSYGDFSLVFETVYYVIGADYNLYMDIQQAINLFIHEKFEEQGIEFAYPTQTLFLERSH